MADDTAESTTTTVETATVETTQQDELGDAGKKALAAERTAKKAAEKKAAELEARLKAIEDKDKSEAERLAERASVAEQAAQEQAAQLARYKVAAATGVPADLLAPSGTDEESLAQYAAALLEWRGSAAPAAGRPAGDIDQGARTTPLALNGSGLEDALKQKLGIR